MSDLREDELAVLAALHHRGALAADEVGRLLGLSDPGTAIADLEARGFLEPVCGRRRAIAHAGRVALDRVLESIESALAPDSPAHAARFRRQTPALPWAASTVWAEAVCVNVRVAPEALRPLVPPVFDLDLQSGWAWVSLTASRLADFGVGRLPGALRANLYQATYRAHVARTDFRGQRVRGYYFVRSETNSALLSFAANRLPEFEAHRCSTYPILMAKNGEHLVLTVDSGDDPAGKVVLVLDADHPHPGMPPGSVFSDLAAARIALVDPLDAFSHDPAADEVLILKIERGEWNLRVLPVVDAYLGYFADGPFRGWPAEIDSVFYFRDTPYRWLPLEREKVRR